MVSAQNWDQRWKKDLKVVGTVIFQNMWNLEYKSGQALILTLKSSKINLFFMSNIKFKLNSKGLF